MDCFLYDVGLRHERVNNVSLFRIVSVSPVKAEHDVKLEKLRDERAAAENDVTRKCKLQTSFNCRTAMALHL